MSPKTDFDKADATFPVVAERETAPDSSGVTLARPPNNMLDRRKNVVMEYYNGAPGLADKLRGQNRDKPEMLVMALVDELIGETDNLLGNGLIATEQGDLRDATIISSKRAEVLEKAIRAVQTKQVFDKTGGIDLSSPSVRIIMRYFMKKAKIVFEQMGMRDEMSDTFFRQLGETMSEWQVELEADLEEMSSLRPRSGDEK